MTDAYSNLETLQSIAMFVISIIPQTVTNFNRGKKAMQYTRKTASDFLGIDEEVLDEMSRSFNPDYIILGERALYSDGDSGLAVITPSDIFDDDLTGVSIAPIDCRYVEINLTLFTEMVVELSKSRRDLLLKDME